MRSLFDLIVLGFYPRQKYSNKKDEKEGEKKLEEGKENEIQGKANDALHQADKAIPEADEETDRQTGCAISSLLLFICILTLLVLLFSAAVIYRGG